MRGLFVAVVVFLSVSMANAAPTDDLASPVQATRDAAAKTLLTSYKPAPRSKWEPVVAALKMGTKKADVLAQLAPHKVTSEGGGAGGGGETATYRLDDHWVVHLAFKTKDSTLFRAELDEGTKHYWVQPPKDFTGVWVIYFANGHKSHEITYKNGKYDGPFLTFHDDGSKSVVQTYGPKGADGDDIGYHRNGKVAYRGKYKDGKEVGTWTWYDENGKVTSTKKQ